MKNDPIQKTAAAISQLMPNIIQGAHLGILTDHPLTQSQFLLLICIHAKGECSMSTLAAHMKVQMPTMTGMVNRLVKAQYLRRIPNLKDRRQVVVDLTPKGKDFLKEFQGIISRRWQDVLKALTVDEVKQFQHIVLKLNHCLRGEGS